MGGLLRFVVVVMAVSGLLACASSPPPDTRPWSVQTAERLERTLGPDRVALAPRQAVEDLERALQLYSLADDQEGQARCHIKLARLYLRSDDEAQAGSHLANARRIAGRLGRRPLQFESALLTGRLSNRREDFEQALGYAGSPIEQAVALTYLGRLEQAYQLVRPHLATADTAPDDFAFVLHRYAVSSRDMATARQSLELYKQTDNHLGAASALYLMGQIATENRNPGQARGYLERALVVSRALSDRSHVQRVEAALEGL